MKYLAYKIKILKLRLTKLRIEILLFGIISIVSIFLIELLLKKIPALNETSYDLGQVYLKLCYSYFSSFIFYLLVVHFPKERRKAKLHRILHNKILYIRRETTILLNTLFKLPNNNIDAENITNDQIKKICDLINPHLPIPVNINGTTVVSFPNLYAFMNLRTKNIKALINDIFLLNDVVDNDLMQGLTNIQDNLSSFFTFDITNIDNGLVLFLSDINIHGNTNLQVLSHNICDLNFETKQLVKNLIKEDWDDYSFEYTHLEYEGDRASHNRF